MGRFLDQTVTMGDLLLFAVAWTFGVAILEALAVAIVAALTHRGGRR